LFEFSSNEIRRPDAGVAMKQISHFEAIGSPCCWHRPGIWIRCRGSFRALSAVYLSVKQRWM